MCDCNRRRGLQGEDICKLRPQNNYDMQAYDTIPTRDYTGMRVGQPEPRDGLNGEKRCIGSTVSLQGKVEIVLGELHGVGW